MKHVKSLPRRLLVIRPAEMQDIYNVRLFLFFYKIRFGTHFPSDKSSHKGNPNIQETLL